MSHTPGPWVLSVDCDEYNILDREATFDEYGVMTGSRPNVIAEAFFVPSVQSAADPMSGYATKLANARLIAAAPDLLEALEEMLEEFSSLAYTSDSGQTCYHEHTPEMLEAMQSAKAAIAKAKEGSA